MTSPDEDNISGLPPAALAPLRHDAPGTNELATQFIDLDRKRIAVEERRTEVALRAVQANQEADERRHISRMLSLELRSKRDDAIRERERFVLWIVAIAILAVTIVGVALITAAFFGTERQSSIALKLLYGLLIAMGGYGAVSGAIGAIKRVLDGRSGPEP